MNIKQIDPILDGAAVVGKWLLIAIGMLFIVNMAVYNAHAVML